MNTDNRREILPVQAIVGAVGASLFGTLGFAASPPHPIPPPRPVSASTARITSDRSNPPVADVFEQVERERRLLAVIEELEHETKNVGWDDEQGRAIGAETWIEVRRVVSLVTRQLEALPAPFISASGDGYAHITWTTHDGDRGVLEIGTTATWWSTIPISPRLPASEGEKLGTADEVFVRLRTLFG